MLEPTYCKHVNPHNKRHMKATTIFVLMFLLASLTGFTATAQSRRLQQKTPATSCNAPPVPAPGQTVTWTLANSPYQICQNITIPTGSTVNVEAGVQVGFNADTQLLVSGTLRLLGQAGSRISFTHPAVFPPMIEINGGALEASFADFGGQLRVNSGAAVMLADSGFAGNGLLLVQEIPSVRPFVHVQRCTFNSSTASISDALSVWEDNFFMNTNLSILRGYADVTATNAFVGGYPWLIREESVQPFFVDGVNTSGSSTPGIVLDGGNYLLGPNNVIQGNLYPVALSGGLLPDSIIPTTGNTNNAIDVGNGGFRGRGRWSNLGLPYRLTQPASDFPGGHLTIDPGVFVEATVSGAAMSFRSTRHGVLKGLPGAQITFRGLNSQPWDGLLFNANSTTGCRMEYCTVSNAQFGVVSTDNTLFVDNCAFTNNNVGANMNTFGSIYFRKTRFTGNAAGVSMSNQGSPFLNSAITPNSFEGNTVGINAFQSGSSADARNCWWNHPSGPTTPGNPGGQGDSIVGAGAANVLFSPFRTSPPDFANTPPVVRLIEPGLTQLYASPDYQIPDFLLDQGTKYIVRWNAQDNDAIVTQRIDFSPDGHYPDRYFTLVNNIPGSARSWEITVPNPDFAATNQPQFLRIVAVDAAGQEGWDQVPVLVPSGRITGTLTITTNLSGQTFVAGQPIPDLNWSGSVNFGTITPIVVLESDGAAVQGLNISGTGMFSQKFPFVSTDRARLALQVRNNSNDVKWFFADGYFSIRHDPRLGFIPPSVNLLSPAGGQLFGGGSTIPISWTATASEGMRSFDIQASYDAGRTWHLIVRDLPASATSYNWQLPASSGIPDVRVRVIARDVRFQNNSSTSAPFGISSAIGAVSRKTHGAAGSFDVDLPLSDPTGIECRSGGVTDDYQLILTFGDSVSVNGNPQAQVTSGTGVVGSGGMSNGGTVSVNGNTVAVPLTSVANAQMIKVTLFGVVNGAVSGNVTIPMRVLVGDTNGNGAVSATDIAQTKAQAGQPVTVGNFRTDVIANGAINASDVAFVKSQSGTSLGPPSQSVEVAR